MIATRHSNMTCTNPPSFPPPPHRLHPQGHSSSLHSGATKTRRQDKIIIILWSIMMPPYPCTPLPLTPYPPLPFTPPTCKIMKILWSIMMMTMMLPQPPLSLSYGSLTLPLTPPYPFSPPYPLSPPTSPSPSPLPPLQARTL